MNSQKIFFGSNIKFLRERRKMNQESLAEKLSLTRSKLNALENGHTKAPQPDDYLRFSDFFKISVDSLLRVNLAKLSELKLRELESGNDVYMTGSNIRVLAITVNEQNKENMEYVPVKAKAGYRSGYGDPEYVSKLPRFNLPNLPRSGTFRMFPTVGDSMLPIPEKSDIVTEYVQDWKSLKPDTLCIVILKGEQDFVFKQVTVGQDSSLLLRSLNPVYAPYRVEAEDVLEVWKYRSFHSQALPSTGSNHDQMMRILLNLQEQVSKIKQSVG